MENQTKRELERGLLLKLRDEVNGQAEFEYVEAELARLDAEGTGAGGKPQPPETVAEAVALLEEWRGYLAVQVEIVPALWKVVSLDGNFEEVFTDSELISFARTEWDVLHKLCRRAGLSSPAELPCYSSCSPVAENRDLLNAAWVYAPTDEAPLPRGDAR
jgi:hypothetical protein